MLQQQRKARVQSWKILPFIAGAVLTVMDKPQHSIKPHLPHIRFQILKRYESSVVGHLKTSVLSMLISHSHAGDPMSVEN